VEVAKDLVYPNSDTTSFCFSRLLYTISCLQGLSVAFRYRGLISMKLLNNKSCCGSFSAADTVPGAGTGFRQQIILALFCAGPGHLQVCVCTTGDHRFSQTIM